MPKYFYTAKSQKEGSLTGTREAKDEHELAKALHQEGYVLISAIPEEKERKKFKLNLPFLNKVSLEEKMMFTRNLKVMISAGISLPKTLKILALQSKSQKFKNTLEKINNQIVKGESFSNSLARHPDIFSELFCELIKAGEEAGILEKNLDILARQMKKDYELRSRIKGAMMYPAVVMFAMFGIGILMLILVVPPLAQTFKELGVELPTTTKVVIMFGTFLAEKWYLVIFIVIFFIFFLRIILKTKQGKKAKDYLILRLPVISSIVKKTNSAYTARILGSLLASGVSLIKSLEILSKILENFYYKQIMIKAIERVKKGDNLSDSLKSCQNLYPIIVIQMIEVGEETGQTSDILEKLADFFEEEVNNITKNLSVIIEPILMLFIGLAVGFFAISMFQPMFGMLGAI